MRKIKDAIWSIGLKKVKSRYQPATDNGFFGPDSVTWKVWAYPSSLLCGFQRAVTIEQLDPHLNAAVEASEGVRSRPRTRYERTVRYFALAAFGDTKTTTKAADVLVKVHSKAIGTDPVTGEAYDANDPDSQLWIHMTAWHSILYCYEKMGPGRLPEEEETQYWIECARAAELQTIDPASVPRSREEVRAYFASWRPKLVASETARSMTKFILHTEILFPEGPTWAKPILIIVARAAALGTVSTYPQHMREMLGLRQPVIFDSAVQKVHRVANALVASNSVLFWLAGRALIPSTMPILAPGLFGIPAQAKTSLTPREAQASYGYDIPAQAHARFRAQQKERVFGQGLLPSDEGLVESQAYLGALAKDSDSKPASVKKQPLEYN